MGGGSGAQDVGCVIGAGFTQYLFQCRVGAFRRMVEASRRAGPGRQLGHRVTGPDAHEFFQQPYDASRIVKADLGGWLAGQQGMDRFVGADFSEPLQQPGDVPCLVEAGLGGSSCR